MRPLDRSYEEAPVARWGLTREMRDSRPWNLDAALLETVKVITDPVHGDIFVTELERRIIDSPPFQRLRRVRQLGTTHLVYPGATHTRFAHSLGSLRVAQDLMDAVLDQELGPHPQPLDLFAEWKQELPAQDYIRRIAEATVLARLGALLHDFTHVAFGHSIEDDLGLLVSHDENAERFAHLWGQLDAEVRDALLTDSLDRFLRPLILSKLEHKDGAGNLRGYAEMVAAAGGSRERALQLEFVADIVGNTICADLLDYLQRDHLNAGLPLALGGRYLSYFYVTPTKGHHYYPARMVLRIQRNGRPRADVVTEILKHLRYRYELSERALVHHTKLAADAMIGKALSMWRDAMWTDLILGELGRPLDDPSRSDVGKLQEELVAARGEAKAEEVDATVRDQMELEVRRRGDDGLLEWLHDWSTRGNAANDRRRAAINRLTAGILERKLFKPVAHVPDVSPGPRVLYERYKNGNLRRVLEQAAARFAGIEGAWRVLLWIPAPTMRLKIAEVLVDTGKGIRRFVDQESRGDRRGADIYDAHRGLWAVTVFVEASIRDDEERVEAIRAYLSAEFEVRVDRMGYEDVVKPADAPDLLAFLLTVRDDAKYAAFRDKPAKILEMLREQRHGRGTEPGATLVERKIEVRDACDALRAARDILGAKRFATLRDSEPLLYKDVLETAAYGIAEGTTQEQWKAAFRAAADARLS